MSRGPWATPREERRPNAPIANTLHDDVADLQGRMHAVMARAEAEGYGYTADTLRIGVRVLGTLSDPRLEKALGRNPRAA